MFLRLLLLLSGKDSMGISTRAVCKLNFVFCLLRLSEGISHNNSPELSMMNGT